MAERAHGWRRHGVLGIIIWFAGVACCAASEPLAHLLACRQVDDAASRLACFDRESAALAATARPQSASPAVVARPPATAALDPHRTFGLPEAGIAAREVVAGARAPELPRISAHLARLTTGPDGRLLFTLDNAQVWQELLPDGELLARAGDAVTISRAFLGSYYLRLPSGRGCKVTRLR